MGNRHHDKKLRAQVRARMSRTGETYQQALERIRGARRAPIPDVDLVAIDWFGGSAALATIQNMGITSFFIVSMPTTRVPLPVPWLRVRSV